MLIRLTKIVKNNTDNPWQKDKTNKTKKFFLSNILYFMFTHLISAEDYADLKNINSLMAYIS